jgi:hypothetical protein
MHDHAGLIVDTAIYGQIMCDTPRQDRALRVSNHTFGVTIDQTSIVPLGAREWDNSGLILVRSAACHEMMIGTDSDQSICIHVYQNTSTFIDRHCTTDRQLNEAQEIGDILLGHHLPERSGNMV